MGTSNCWNTSGLSNEDVFTEAYSMRLCAVVSELESCPDPLKDQEISSGHEIPSNVSIQEASKWHNKMERYSKHFTPLLEKSLK